MKKFAIVLRKVQFFARIEDRAPGQATFMSEHLCRK